MGNKIIFEFTDTNFEQEVLNSEIPVMVDFWAEWCSPCKMIIPMIEELSVKFEGRCKVGKVNVDESPNITERNSVMNIPTLVFFKGGEETSRMIGINPKEKISKKIEELI